MTDLRSAASGPLIRAGHPRPVLSAWMGHMEGYGEVWYEDIGRDYFNQEYWYLLVSVIVRYWRGELMNVGAACACMKTGSIRTREARLRRLLDARWIEKSKSAPDRRQTCVLPTPDMQRIVGAHLRRSLIEVARFAHEAGILDAVEPLARSLKNDTGALSETHLLPWAEFLIEYTDDWNATFGNRFHTEEYWHPFVHCLLAFWAGSPLTIGEACQTMRTGSNRTRESRIAIALMRDLLVKRKTDSDLRTLLVVPAPELERCLVAHFDRTLEQLVRLLRDLLNRARAGGPAGSP